MWAEPFANDSFEVTVTAPFVELHTGPGRGYPIVHVAAQGEQLEIIKRRNNWYLVKFHSKRKVVKAWVKASQIAQTQTASGEYVAPDEAQKDDFDQRDFELGFAYGEIDGTSLLSLNAAWWLSDYFALETSIEQAPGVSADQLIATFGISHSPFPKARFSPFFSLGTGAIYTDYKTQLIEGADDSVDEAAFASAGVRIYLTRHFILRAEYRNSVIFTSTDDNKDPEIWKLGLSLFY